MKAPVLFFAMLAHSDLMIEHWNDAALSNREMRPEGQALLRRATFDLACLPSSIREIDAFRADSSAQAFEKGVDGAGQKRDVTGAPPIPSVPLPPLEQERKLAAMRTKIDAAERQLRDARDTAAADFVVWSDKLPEGPNELKPSGAIAEFAFEDLAQKPMVVAGDPMLVEGPRGKALALDGWNGVQFPGLGHFTRSDPFTFSLWLKMPDVTECAVVFHRGRVQAEVGGRGYELLLERGRVAFGMHHHWPENSVKVVAPTPLIAGRWTHIAVTYDGSSRAAGVRIFIDGISAPTDVVRDGLSKDIAAGDGGPDLAIGYRFRDTGFKRGQVDDFHIYGRTLAPIEIASLAGFEVFTKAVQSIPELAPAQRLALIEYYIATVHQPSVEAREVLKSARDEERKFVDGIP